MALVTLLCRPPDAPDSKTRLARAMGRARATELYKNLLVDVLATLGTLEGQAGLRVAVAGPPLSLAELCTDALPSVELVQQVGRSFAERQRHEIARGLHDGFRRVVLVASDLVGLDVPALRWAIDGDERQVSVVLAPDGGYSLLGASVPLPELTSVPMSTGRTGVELIDALRRGGKRVRVADFVVRDIDVAQDLVHVHGSSALVRGAGETARTGRGMGG
jgi:glycosyltransferase A (GT-A) superfamily protein (DUF2064 family)